MTETAPATLKRTTCYDQHKAEGARFVDFHGWELPIQFKSIVTEHEAVRKAAGLFDVSHMGQILIEGSAAQNFIQRSICSNISKAKPGHALYTHILNESGGVIDDLIVYCLGPGRYFLVPNASNSEKVFAWLKRGGVPAEMIYEDASQLYGMLALQGPKAAEIMKLICPDAVALTYFGCMEKEIFGRNCLIGRTGYTGEDGFEIIVPEEVMARLWSDLKEKGAPLGLESCGLGARDTLRLEAGFLLHGNDLDEQHTPLEAGAQWLVYLEGAGFTGREALQKQAKEGLKRKLVGVKVTGGVPRPGCRMLMAGKPIGVLSSGTYGPTLKCGIGMGYITEFQGVFAGAEIQVEIHGKPVAGMVYPPPFYRRPGAPARKKK